MIVVVDVLRRVGQHRALRDEAVRGIGIRFAIDGRPELKPVAIGVIVGAVPLVQIRRLEQIRREHRLRRAVDAGQVRVEPDDAGVGRVLAAEIEIRLAVVNERARIEQPLRRGGRAGRGGVDQ